MPIAIVARIDRQETYNDMVSYPVLGIDDKHNYVGNQRSTAE